MPRPRADAILPAPPPSQSRTLPDLAAELAHALSPNFRLVRELGGGGMSRVFLAEDLSLGREVVVKVLPPEMAAGVSTERFRLEMQTIARLQHPHIVPILSAGAAGDVLFYLMPFIKGESLRTRLERDGALPVQEAARILLHVADALAFAHEEGVVHRDIKPDNVLLSSGHALVTDFGVAKALGDTGRGSGLTSVGIALGTPMYMAPEQATADPHTDHRADLYALGVMAYEMLTGQPPFIGPTVQAVVAAHLIDEPPPLLSHRSTVPEALAAAIHRCLAKRPADRYQQAAELIPVLQAIAHPSGGITPVPLPGTVARAGTVATPAAPTRRSTTTVALRFAAATAAVLALTWGLTLAFGLPDWVIIGAAVLLAVGLPVTLLASRRGSTRRTTRLGGYAFAGLAVATGIFMGLRTLGIGPFATLLSAGTITERERLLVAEFTNSTPDTLLGLTLAEALRVDLSQSAVVRLVPPADVADALVRMQRDRATRLTPEIAGEIAQREGIKVVVLGDVAPLAGGYSISARIAAADGTTLLAERATATGPGDLLAALDKVSRKLREGLGESLRSIRGTESLEQVTTTSLEALQLYTRALRSKDVGADEDQVALLRQAVALDSTFAMAWRLLGAVLTNAHADPAQVLDAFDRSYRFRDRLPAREALHTEARHMMDYGEKERAADTYARILATWPDDRTARNSLGLIYRVLGRYSEAERIFAPSVDSGTAPASSYYNLLTSQIPQGRFAEAETTLARMRQRYPTSPMRWQLQYFLASTTGDTTAARAAADSLTGAGALYRYFGFEHRANLAVLHGRLRDAERSVRAAQEAQQALGNPHGVIQEQLQLGWAELRLRNDSAAALRRLEEALAVTPLDSLPPLSRPYGDLIWLNASLGRLTEARQAAAAAEAALPVELRNANERWRRGMARLALAEERHAEAVQLARQAQRDGGCAVCQNDVVGEAFERLGLPDSAIAAYETLLGPPVFGSEFADWRPAIVPRTLYRLGELYEAKGERQLARDRYNAFIDLWKDADAELQPMVAEARRRVQELAREP